MDEFQIGIVGSAVLIGLVLIGVRVVYACALVGLLGLVIVIWFLFIDVWYYNIPKE